MRGEAHCRLVLVPPNCIKFGIRGQLTDVITCVKCLVNRFRSYRVLTPPKLPFPIDLLRRPYNSVALPCDTVITVSTAVRHCERKSVSTELSVSPLRYCFAFQRRNFTFCRLRAQTTCSASDPSPGEFLCYDLIDVWAQRFCAVLAQK